MSDKTEGDPRSVRHLRPDYVGGSLNMPSAVSAEDPDEGLTAFANDDMSDIFDSLAKLRTPFRADMIEKLPKPMWKDAWKDARGQRCDICHGYHPAQNTIHLDYVGHANVTNRLLEVDPLWTWEPLAYTEAGTPMFSDGGLWIKLTVCGVTRIGFGDGKNVKEVIGDAIRNAAMRFGVALDLWSKIDLHAERNPGDGETSRLQSGGSQNSQAGGGRGDRNTQRRQQRPDLADSGAAEGAQPRAANQHALDSLNSVCKEYGYSTQYCIDRFYSDHDKHVRDADADTITAFAATLIAEATPEPDAGTGSEALADEAGAVRPAGSDTVAAGQAGDRDAGDRQSPDEEMF